MALSRTKTWISGEVLTASDLNAEFNNIINNPSSLICPITFNLTFTDATYDIGASGATRPRDLFLSRNATIGGAVFVGDTANASSTLGITVNQGAADDEIVSLKSSDIAHGMTALTETDTFAYMAKVRAANGGLLIHGLEESNDGGALIIRGTVGATADTTKATSSTGVVVIDSSIKNGTGKTVVGGNGNLLAIQNDSTTRFILDADGDSHQDVGTAWTNFDTVDDIQMLNALAFNLSNRDDDPARLVLGEWLSQHRQTLQRMNIVRFSKDGHHFANMSKLTMLLVGAVRQLSREVFIAREEVKAIKDGR